MSLEAGSDGWEGAAVDCVGVGRREIDASISSTTEILDILLTLSSGD
jgi:hypothetical protein